MTVQERLVTCFAAVFNDLSPEQITGATRESVAAWDSLASLNVITVIEEEFGVEADLLAMGELGSFAEFLSYVEAALSST